MPTVSISIANPTSPSSATVWLSRVDGAEDVRADQHAGEDLADDDRHEPSSRERKQRPAQPGENDHQQRAEAGHRRIIALPSVSCIRRQPLRRRSGIVGVGKSAARGRVCRCSTT